MVVIEGGGGPRRSAGAVGIDPGLAFGLDVALTRADQAAHDLAWRIRSALRAAGASANAPVKLDAVGAWAIEWRDDTRHRLAVLRGGIGTGMTPWGPGQLRLPTHLAFPGGLDGGARNDYEGWLADFDDEIAWGKATATAADYLTRLDDILLVAGLDDAAERANIIHQMIRNGGKIPTDIVAAYARSDAADLVRSADGIPLGPLLSAITLPADIVSLTQGPQGDTTEDHIDYALLSAGVVAGGLEVAGLAVSVGLINSTGFVAAAATGPVGLAFIAGVGIVTVAWEVYKNWDEITELAGQGLQIVGEKIGDIDQWIEDQTDAAAAWLMEGGEELLESLEVTFDETVAGVSAWVTDTEDALRGAAADLQADLEDLAAQGAEAAADTYRATADAVTDVAAEAGRRAGDLAEDAGELIGAGLAGANDVAYGLVERGDAMLRTVGDTVTFWD